MAETSSALKYFKKDIYLEPKADVFTSGFTLPELGFVHSYLAIANPCYVITDLKNEVVFRELTQFGKVVYSVGAESNPACASFLPGGWYENNILLYGRIASIHSTVESDDVYRRFLSAIVETCDKVREFYVGAGAMKMMRQGARLTGSAHASADFDLKSPEY